MCDRVNEGLALPHLERTEMLFGTEPLNRLRQKRVAIFGVGGVGGYVVEALARTGIGTLDLVDNDSVSESNLNRQIIATRDTIGRTKVGVAAQRIQNIDSGIKVNLYETFYLPEAQGDIPFDDFDYIVDAIDTVSAKIDLVIQAEKRGTPIISAMGCGNRLNPEKLVCTDIYKTEMDPLAKVMRKELRNRDVKKLKVVYSTETPIKPMTKPLENLSVKDSVEAVSYNESKQLLKPRKSVPGSTVFVPAAAGIIIASEVFKDLLDLE